MVPTCPTCRRGLTFFPQTFEWGCDACRQMFPASIGRVRAKVWTDGKAALPSAYIGDFWLERDRVSFAATAKAGGRFWGFVTAMGIGMVAGKHAARAAGGALYSYAPSLDKPGSHVIGFGELAAVTEVSKGTWELRLHPNQRGIDRVVVQPYVARPLEHLRTLGAPTPNLPPLPPPHAPIPTPAWYEIIGIPLGILTASLTDGLRRRMENPYEKGDDLTIIAVCGAFCLLAAIWSVVRLRRTRGAGRIGRVILALALAGFAINAAVALIDVTTDPPVKRDR